MGPRRTVALVGALGALVVALPAASAGRGPIAGIACKRTAPGVCEEAGNIGLPAHGAGSQATDTVPGGATTARLFVEPLSRADLSVFDGVWEDVVGAYPSVARITSTPLRRALTCVVMARGVAALAKAQRLQTTGSLPADRSVYTSFLATCIQMTVLAQDAVGPARAAPASARCSTVGVSVPILISKTRAGYVVKLNGQTSPASGPGQLAVSCQVKGNGIQIGIRTRSKRRKLRSILGSHLQLGYANSTSKPLTIRTTFRLGP